MTSAELLTDNPEKAQELKQRQDEFAALLGIDAEELRGLEFCSECHGEAYQWTDLDVSFVDVDGWEIGPGEEVMEYRAYLAESQCSDCDGTGFKGGNFELTAEEWQQLGKTD